MRFVEFCFQYPLSMPTVNEDYFHLPLEIACELGLRPTVYTRANSWQTKKKETCGEVTVYRFKDSFSLISKIARSRSNLAHGHSFGFPPSIIAAVFNKKYVFTPHLYRLQTYKWKPKLALLLLKTASYIVLLTEFERKEFIKAGIPLEKTKVIPCPIDYEFFTSDGAEEIRSKFQINGKFIVCVANFSPRKNLETLIFAFNNVRKVFPGAKLVIAGAPAMDLNLNVFRGYHWRILDLVRSLHIRDDVILTGHLQGTDLRALYNAADIFALPSKSEGQCIAACEAAASGTPLVLSNVEPLLEIFHDCALFHNPLDWNALAKHLVTLLANRKLGRNLGERGRETMKSYDISVIKEQLRDVYKNLLAA